MIIQPTAIQPRFSMPAVVAQPQTLCVDTFMSGGRGSSGKRVRLMAAGAGAVAGAAGLAYATSGLTGAAAAVAGGVQGAVAIGVGMALVGGIAASRLWKKNDLSDVAAGMAGMAIGGGVGVIGGAIAGARIGVGAGNVLGVAAGAIAGAVVGYVFGKGMTS